VIPVGLELRRRDDALQADLGEDIEEADDADRQHRGTAREKTAGHRRNAAGAMPA
jgi:hypothetical protein